MHRGSKKFWQNLKSLLISMKKYIVPIIIATIFATSASIITLLTPNKISNLTNELANGLVPQKAALTEISNHISTNLDEKRIKDISTQFINIDQSKLIIVLNSNKFSNKDKNIIKQEFLKKDFSNFLKLDNTTKRFILKDSKYNDKIITKEDIIIFLDCLGRNDFGNIPKDILEIILPGFKVKGTYISTDDQKKIISLYKDAANLNEDELLKNFDKLPKNVYDLVKPVINMKNIKKISLEVIILYFITTLFSYIEGLIIVTVAIKYSKKLRQKIINKIHKLPLRYFDNTTVGDVLSRITNDVNMINSAMNDSLSSLISALTLFIGSIIMMIKTNGILALTSIVSSLIGFAFLSIIIKKSQKYFVTRQKQLGKLNGCIEEVYTNHNVVKLYNGKKISDENFNKLNEQVYLCEKKSQFLAGIMSPIMAFVGNFGYVAVCVVGAILTMKGHITFGVIVAFMLYVRLFTNPLSTIAQALSSLQSGTAASERVFEFLNQEELPSEEEKTIKLDCKKVKGKIDFKNVKFGYNKNKLIIKDFSAKINPGEKIAIVGPTGAGKTTLVNLLMRFYDINSGDITIDDVSINDVTRENIHDLFVMVLQDTWLFNGTIRDNILFNKENISDKDIWKVCDVVGLSHYIRTLPHGLDSEITDTDSISAGQKQLLTIARGMIKNAPFLIIDEATSNVDTRTEELVQLAMDKLMENKTSFIIAHRLSTIKNADLILVLKDGNIIEQGNHEDLLNQKGFYYKLYNSQFEKIDD